MIKPKDIKWILDNFEVEGFSVSMPDSFFLLSTPYDKYYLGVSNRPYGERLRFQSLVYPLFLQRVIESMGNNSDYIFIQSNDFINVTHKDSEFITDEVFGEDDSLIDECKEKAIMYIVEQMREGE